MRGYYAIGVRVMLNDHDLFLARTLDDARDAVQYLKALEAERHACPTCNRLATLLVNADACPLQLADYPGCDRYFCADEDTADCAARIVAWEEGL
jgi:hypothetical protein